MVAVGLGMGRTLLQGQRRVGHMGFRDVGARKVMPGMRRYLLAGQGWVSAVGHGDMWGRKVMLGLGGHLLQGQRRVGAVGFVVDRGVVGNVVDDGWWVASQVDGVALHATLGRTSSRLHSHPHIHKDEAFVDALINPQCSCMQQGAKQPSTHTLRRPGLE